MTALGVSPGPVEGEAAVPAGTGAAWRTAPQAARDREGGRVSDDLDHGFHAGWRYALYGQPADELLAAVPAEHLPLVASALLAELRAAQEALDRLRADLDQLRADLAPRRELDGQTAIPVGGEAA